LLPQGVGGDVKELGGVDFGIFFSTILALLALQNYVHQTPVSQRHLGKTGFETPRISPQRTITVIDLLRALRVRGLAQNVIQSTPIAVSEGKAIST